MTAKTLEKLSALIGAFQTGAQTMTWVQEGDSLVAVDRTSEPRQALVDFVANYGLQQRREGRREGRREVKP